MRRRKRLHVFVLAALPCLLAPGLGCRAVESPQELQALAGEASPERPAEISSSPPPAAAPVAGDSLDSFPLVGSVFPGLGGRLHSSLCDPASDPYSTCI